MTSHKKEEYVPLQLDLESLRDTSGSPETGYTYTGAIQHRNEEQRKRKLTVLVWGAIGTVALVLIVLSAVTFGEVHQQSSGCQGSDLVCRVINDKPYLDRDFRNLPRQATGSRGMVAADNSRCSEIGLDVLKDGGNAVDAAVATTFCTGVIHPIASGVGGGMFMTIRMANGTAVFIDAREPAPAAANATMFDGKSSSLWINGGLSVGVFQEVKGLETAWRRFGKLPWERLVRPSVGLARNGFALHPYLHYILSSPATLELMKRSPGLRDAYLKPDGAGGWRLPEVGEPCCRRPRFADTLEQVANNGAAWLYSKDVATTLAEEIQAAGGIMTAEDLMDTQPAVTEPLRATVGGYEVIFPPPPSSGAAVVMALRFLAGYNATGNKDLKLYRLVEAMKHAFAVRLSLGDPGTRDRPFANLTEVLADLQSEEFISGLRAGTSDARASNVSEYGGRWNPYKMNLAAVPDDHGTSQICVVDGDHNAVSLTSTINTVFGSGVVSPSTGIIFNNEMDDFSSPNKSTFITPHPSSANFIAPGKRPLSAMSPTIVVNSTDGSLKMAVGASGGTLIVTATLQALVRVLLDGATPFAAIHDPRVHDQLLNGAFAPPGSVLVENMTWGHLDITLPAASRQFLLQKGDPQFSLSVGLGVAQTIVMETPGQQNNRQGPVMVGVSDARKDGAPMGF